MFERVELPLDLCRYLISISPLLGISQSIDNPKLHAISKYIALKNNKILILFQQNEIPSELSLNILRKGEDGILIRAYKSASIEQKYLKEGKSISSPSYIHSVISFELSLEEITIIDSNNYLALYNPTYVSGVEGLDPSFNDDITISKTLEVMSLTSVDKYVIENKIGTKV